MGNVNIRKNNHIILLAVNSILLISSLLYFLNGSLEMFPTEEKQESIKTIIGGLVIVFLIIEIVLLVHTNRN